MKAKTMNARLTEDQLNRLKEVGEKIGWSVSKMNQHAVERWLEIEAPVRVADAIATEKKLTAKRQHVAAEKVSA